MNKKLRKLKKNPKLFFSDMLKKRVSDVPIKYTPWKKESGKFKYTIISAVYGVEKYLDKFFFSIVNQRLNFEEHIELIMIDDGSLDSSANIIKKWMRKFPKNIFYYKKKNGGQASARNYGMQFSSHKWVTFIDPDDFLDDRYFSEVDGFISNNLNIKLVSCNVIFYMEGSSTFRDSHALKFRFHHNESVFSIDKLDNYIQLSVNSVFFRKDVILEASLEMDARIKPTFEDANFVGKYLLSLDKGSDIVFLKTAKYFYRKRKNESSAVDKAWEDKASFYNKIKYGFLDILLYAHNKNGVIPRYIQNMVIYDYYWYCKYIINNGSKFSFLTEEEVSDFFDLSEKVFSYIDKDVIYDFNLSGYWFFYKVGMLGLYKDISPSLQRVYIKNYDPVKKLVKLVYYYNKHPPLERFHLDGGDTLIPEYTKTRVYDFLGHVFVYEHIAWLPLDSQYKMLQVHMEGIGVRLVLGGRPYYGEIPTVDIINKFDGNATPTPKYLPSSVVTLRQKARSPSVVDKYKNAWVFMDRDIQADDNAEHLYRYIANTYPSINSFFLLLQSSKDWERLKEEGFNLLEFNSESHQLAILNADHFISSHADHYIISFIEDKWFSDMVSCSFTFLQHGVIQNDLSKWLNGQPIDLFITTTAKEFLSIAGDNNHYKYTPKEVSLTGLPRHDSLLKLNDEIDNEKLILIMPTWRQGIVGKSVGLGADRNINSLFYSSEYACAWKSFLHSDELKKYVQEDGCKVMFFPHVIVRPYLDWFNIPNYIETVASSQIESIQTIFSRASVLITDYSSVAFDMAYLYKAIIYYQFDREIIFKGAHTSNEGYYDYQEDGFGAVCSTEEELYFELKKLLKNNFTPEQSYLDRSRKTFVYRDKLCSERTYLAILNLQKETVISKIKGHYKYSIVCAVYGVEEYLEQFFSSIINQELDFESHIEIIMIDDGSLDGSANVIKKWVSLYPNNIFYYKKENGGQASARNYGMQFVSNYWVSFIDPDDFVDNKYFLEVDKYIYQEKNIGMVSCNFIFYKEESNEYSDSHPLKFRFSKVESTFKVGSFGQNIQLSVNSAFFRTSIIIDNSLEMDERIKPSFEDAHFVGKYLLLLNNENIGFLKLAKYFYRKREDGSSTLDTTWQSKKHYCDKLKYGSLDLLESSLRKKKKVPEYIQRTVLYDYIWYVKYIVNHQELLSFLDQKDKLEFIELSKNIFSYIDSNVIEGFNLAGCWFFHKVGMLGYFKKERFSHQIVYMPTYDSISGCLQIKYFYSNAMPEESFYINEEKIDPLFSTIRVHDFLGENFVNERIIWLSLNNTYHNLAISLDGFDTRLSMAGRQYAGGVSIAHIINILKKQRLDDLRFPASVRLLRKQSRAVDALRVYKNAWVLMDRDTQSDDNAEHLYRYLSENHPDLNIFFVLRKTSYDWQRLRSLKFNLLEFNSNAHHLALLNADHLISSHADHYVTNLLDRKWYSDMLNYRYTFLQHGVTQNDLSNWLNSKPIDLFITVTPEEFNSIVGKKTRYKYSKKEVSLTGLPRHDTLLGLNKRIGTEKLIVIMPTWRQGITGNTLGLGNDREVNKEFYSSDYALAWKSFLHLEKLEKLSTLHGYKIVFFPHANMQLYTDWFDVPKYIEVISADSIQSMQHLFCKASIMITDYSSVAFEMAYLDKAVIYYQFDYNFVFGGGHTTSKGYYNYKKDGFGEVCATEQELFLSLSKLLQNNGKLEDVYQQRINNTFIYRDGLCCQRVYAAIQNINV